MSEELRPSPFCGGEAKIQEYNGGFAAVGCSNGRCYMHPHAFGFASAEDAIQKWNRRAERTCRIIEDGCGLAHCSECGSEFDPYDCAGIPEEGVPYEYDGRYCKNCGAKVVDG